MAPLSNLRDWNHGWLVIPQEPYNRNLHRIKTIDDTTGNGTALCGLTGTFETPGPFTQRGLPRCEACCDQLGIRHGIGTPFYAGIEEAAA